MLFRSVKEDRDLVIGVGGDVPAWCYSPNYTIMKIAFLVFRATAVCLRVRTHGDVV